jgi:repressor LexA
MEVMMKNKLSEKQVQILNFVNEQVKEKGYPPSVREICKAVGFKSTSTVHGYLEKLKETGLIQKDPSKPRAIKVMSNKTDRNNPAGSAKIFPSREMVEIPVIGKVTAGQPILAVENIEDSFPLPVDYVGNATTFMLRISGDSMVEAGILDNDLVLVRQQNFAENGDYVVALLGDEATVKTFYKEKDHIRLQPENQYLEPIIVSEGISILGKVIGVFRML